MTEITGNKTIPEDSTRPVSVFFLLCLFIIPFTAYSQDQDFRPSRQAASEAYSRNNFEEAYRHYSGLLSLYPKDPLYKYLAGICLVRLQRDPSVAVKNLREAAENTGAVKPVPADVWFWLGRAQQMAGMYNDAVASFNKYTGLAGKKVAREMNVPDYIRDASERKGAIEMPVSVNAPGRPAGVPDAPLINKVPDSEPKESKKIIPEKEPAPPEVDSLLGRLLADTLWKTTPARDTDKSLPLQKGGLNEGKMTDKPAAVKTDTIEEISRVSHKTEEQKTNAKDTLKTGAIMGAGVSAGLALSRKPLFSLFEINDKPGPEKIPINPPVPPGLVYRIQVAIFRNPVNPSYFKGLRPVEGFRNEGSDLTVYYAGLFRKSADASQALAKVRSAGFKDAFVVALMDKKQVSSERAALLEKEWASKPLTEEEVKVSPADTIPPTLVFRVELMRSQKPVAKEKMEEIKRVAGDRGLDILTDDKKQNIYLIGVFLSFKSATEYSDLLIRNGYKDAKVVAYLGQKEIPVDIARKLFEEY